jgi:hypothetical protein
MASSHLVTDETFFLLTLSLDRSIFFLMGLSPESFRTQITGAKQRIQKLRGEERKIKEEISDLRALIRANIAFLPEPERTSQTFLFDLFQQPSNIGEAVRATLMISTFLNPEGIKATDVKTAAEYMFGFDFSEYTNPAASIATVLRRLRESGAVSYNEEKETYLFKESFPEIMNPDLLQKVANQAMAEMRNQIGKEKMDELLGKLGHEESQRIIAVHSKSKDE